MAGDEDDLGVGQDLGVVEELHAAAVGQDQVEQHDVRLLQGHLAARIAQRARGGDGEALVGDEHRHRLGRIKIVVYDECVRHSALFSMMRGILHVFGA